MALVAGCAEEAGLDLDAGPAQVAEAGGHPARCPWSIDALLKEIGEAEFVGRNCGSSSAATVKGPFSCFEGERATDKPVLFSINRCTDCFVSFTYLARGSDLFELGMEDDSFGDSQRETTVARCAAITFEAVDMSGWGDVKCVERSELYRCSESRSLPLR